MTIKEITNPILEVRILKNTKEGYAEGWSKDEKMNEMVGGIFEVQDDYRGNEKFCVWKDKANDNFYTFPKSDCQVLTPVIKDGYQIGIGDEVNKAWIVVGYYWAYSEWRVVCVNEKNITDTTWYKYKDENLKITKRLYKEDKSGLKLKDAHIVDIINELSRRGKEK